MKEYLAPFSRELELRYELSFLLSGTPDAEDYGDNDLGTI